MSTPTASLSIDCTPFGASRVYDTEVQAFCGQLPVLNPELIGVAAVAIIIDPTTKRPNRELAAAEQIADSVREVTLKRAGIANSTAVLGVIGPCDCVGYDTPVYAVILYSLADLKINQEDRDDGEETDLDAVAETIQSLVEESLTTAGLNNKVVVGVEVIGDTLDILHEAPALPLEAHNPNGDVEHIIIGFEAGDECKLISNEPPEAEPTKVDGTKCDICPERGTCVVFDEPLIHGGVPVGAMPHVVLPPAGSAGYAFGTSLNDNTEVRLSDGTLVPPLTPTGYIPNGAVSGDRSAVYLVFPRQ